MTTLTKHEREAMKAEEKREILDRVATHLAMHIQEQNNGEGPICVHIAAAYNLVIKALP